MDKQIKTFSIETKAVDPEQGIYEAMLSTEAVDRDGDVLLASGADTSAYLRNPVVLFGHNYNDPNAVVAGAGNHHHLRQRHKVGIPVLTARH